MLFLIAAFCFGLLSIFLYLWDVRFENQWLVFLTWQFSVLLAIFSFPLQAKPKKIKKCLLENKKEFIWLLLILVGAVLARLYKLEEIPILGHDEARDAGLLPQAFLRGEIKDFFGYGVYGISNMFIVLASVPHLLFPKTVLAVKFFSVLFGVLSVLLTYVLARKLFSREIAIIAAILLSFYHVHLHFSRSEFINLFDSFWAPLLVLSLILAIEKNWYYSLPFGLIAGLSLHFYQGIRVVVLTSFLYLLVYLLFKQKKAFFKKISLCVFGFFIGFGPSLLVLLTRSSEFLNTGTAGRPIILGITISELIKILPERILRAFGSTIYYPIDFHYHYGGPFLQFPANLFFLIGLVVIFKKINLVRYNILLFWLGLVLFFNSAILPNMNFTHRLLSLVPTLMIILSLGISRLARVFKNYSTVFIGSILILISFLNIKTYFLDSVWEKALLLNTDVATPAGYYVKQFPRSVKFYFLNSSRMGWKSVPSWEYLNQDYYITDIPGERFNDLILEITKDPEEAVFIALPERESDFSILKNSFPGGKERVFYFDERVIFKSYELLDSKKATPNTSSNKTIDDTLISFTGSPAIWT